MTESALGFTTRRYINPLYLYLYLLPDSTYLSVVGSGYMGGFQHISAVGYLGSMTFVLQRSDTALQSARVHDDQLDSHYKTHIFILTL